MIYTFITDSDIRTAIRADLLSNFAESDEELTSYIANAEKTAIQQIKSKIGDRFDIAQIFPVITNYDETKQYNEGDYVSYNDVIYIALTDNIGSIPPDNEADWSMHDPRHDLIISYCVDMTLYHLHKRINPRKIPELRVEAYKDAIAWFEMLKKGEETPDLPFLDEGEEYIPWGSNPKQDFYY